MTSFNESTVEQAAMEWLSDLGWETASGPDIAPGTPAPERDNYTEVVLERRLKDALERLNPGPPAIGAGDRPPEPHQPWRPSPGE